MIWYCPIAFFLSFSGDPRHTGRRLSRKAYNRVLERISKIAGIPARPHDLRRSAINTAGEETGYNAALMQDYGRHASFDVTKRYAGKLQAKRARVAEMVAKRMMPQDSSADSS